MTTRDFELLVNEHHTLLRELGRALARCSALLATQAREIAHLRAQAIRLRATVIAHQTALAWAREDRAALERSIPGLARRSALAQQVEALMARVQNLIRARQQQELKATQGLVGAADSRPDDAEALEASLRAADLVICQTGCLSHGAYWRVQDHCRRTGKTCVIAERPEALRIVRIHAARIDDPRGQASALLSSRDPE